MSEDPKTREENIDRLKILNKKLGVFSFKVNKNTFTEKKTEGPYPLSVGYSCYVRRPMQDLLKWMDTVEETLALIAVELERSES